MCSLPPLHTGSVVEKHYQMIKGAALKYVLCENFNTVPLVFIQQPKPNVDHTPLRCVVVVVVLNTLEKRYAGNTNQQK